MCIRDRPIATSTGAVAPGNEFNAPPGVIVTIPTSFSGNDQATFSWSGLNNGMFYKAGQLIEANRQYIIDTTHAWMVTTYPSLAAVAGTAATKCKRDIGLILDAYVYHLKQGGNFKIVEAAQLYYTKNEYPYGETRTSLVGVLTEALATFNYAKGLAIQAMRNQLPATDPDVLVLSLIHISEPTRPY